MEGEGLESLWLLHIPEFLKTFAGRDLQDRTVGKQVGSLTLSGP